MHGGYVYILGSHTGTLYIGVTSRLGSRIAEHKSGKGSAFTSKYGCTRLLFYETFSDIRDAITREKQLKDKTRAKKLALVQSDNPEFRDLAEKWGWLRVGPAHSIAEEEARLQSRYRLPRGPSLHSG